MKKILVINSSIGNNEQSITFLALNNFINDYKKTNPNDEFIFLNLNDEKEITSNILNTYNFGKFWNGKSDEWIKMINDADKIIITTSMVNFFITPTLKNFFDKVLIANKTFRYKYTDGTNKSEGLIKAGKKALLIMSQGASTNVYPFTNFEFYLKGVLDFIGIKDIKSIVISGTKENQKSKISNEEKIKLESKSFAECLSWFLI